MATAAQHQELDADYERWLKALPEWNFWGHLGVLREWANEKKYLDRYGQRYPVITNISAG